MTEHKTGSPLLIAIGGGGANILKNIQHLIPSGMRTLAVNADDAVVERWLPDSTERLLIGQSLLNGKGCGGNPKLGKEAAMKSRSKMARCLSNTSAAIFIATFGGGTGSGATPVFVQLALYEKIPTFVFFSMPFSFEGTHRSTAARQASEEIERMPVMFLGVNNDIILRSEKSDITVTEAFRSIDTRIGKILLGILPHLL